MTEPPSPLVRSAMPAPIMGQDQKSGAQGSLTGTPSAINRIATPTRRMHFGMPYPTDTPGFSPEPGLLARGRRGRQALSRATGQMSVPLPMPGGQASIPFVVPGCNSPRARPDHMLQPTGWGTSTGSDFIGAALETTAVESSAPEALSLGLQAGAYTMTGKKAGCPDWANQDAYLVVPAEWDRMFLAVFDGHGEFGSHIACSACGLFEQLAPGLLALPLAQLPDAFAQLFAVAQSALKRDPMAKLSGTTATAVVIDVAAGCLTSAHVGDSRLMMVSGDARVEFETLDHTVEGNEERRVLASGGDVRDLCHRGISARRVFLRGSDYPGLAMSRSLGDLDAHTVGVSAEPTIHDRVPFRSGSSIIVASDGVWEKLPRNVTCAMGVGNPDPAEASRSVVMEARSRWPVEGDTDDITTVVVRAVPSDRDGSFAVAAAGA